MTEYMKRYYQKEEEFLDEFPSIANEAAKLLDDEWKPNFDCDDTVRRTRDYFLSMGELHSFVEPHSLVFDGAAAYHEQNRFSSAQIVLKSSNRIVTVRVVKTKDGLVAEKLADKNAQDGTFKLK
ncbi:MAG: hypothetical protein NTY36_13095 [Deltaproteobacteria bacterium]|nr:hypothetical protein [Deltaproteobacteria bacterium]